MNSNEDQTNSEIINEKDLLLEESKIDEKSIDIENKYKFGWSSYPEITNGRFAMLGFFAIIIIELLSKQSFLQWAGIL